MAAVTAYQIREIYSLYICFVMLLRCIPFCSYLMEPAGHGAPQRMLSQAQHQYYWVSVPGNVNHTLSSPDAKAKMRADVVPKIVRCWSLLIFNYSITVMKLYCGCNCCFRFRSWSDIFLRISSSQGMNMLTRSMTDWLPSTIKLLKSAVTL